MGRKSTRGEGAWRVIQLDWTRYDHRNRAIHHPTTDPSWDQIREAIQTLDGGQQSDLVFVAANGNMMCIGGGQGRYVVITQTGRHLLTGVAANLVNPLGGEAVEGGVVVGGCQTELPEWYVVNLEMVLQAAERFYRAGELDPYLVWEPN